MIDHTLCQTSQCTLIVIMSLSRCYLQTATITTIATIAATATTATTKTTTTTATTAMYDGHDGFDSHDGYNSHDGCSSNNSHDSHEGSIMQNLSYGFHERILIRVNFVVRIHCADFIVPIPSFGSIVQSSLSRGFHPLRVLLCRFRCADSIA